MGYNTEQFVDKVDENLECSICLEVLEDPWQCKDGHIYCKECITRCLENRQVCPMDNNALHFKDLARSVVVKNMVESLEVYCHPPERDGKEADVDNTRLSQCGWTGKLQSLAKHRLMCPFQEVQCPNVNCNTAMQRRELEDHDKTCEFKEVECQKCGKVLIRLEIPVHKNEECPEELLLCPNKCTFRSQTSKIKRKNLADHVRNACAKTILDCSFKDQGCSVQVERQHVDQHIQDNLTTHMMLLARQCSALTKQNLSLVEQNTTLTKQCSALEMKCSSLDIKLREVEEECKKNDELSRTYSWKVDSSYLRLDRTIRSPTFWLCGFSWYLKLHLKENTVELCLDKNSGSKDDTLRKNCDISVSCRFTMTGPLGNERSSEERHIYCHSFYSGILKWEGLKLHSTSFSSPNGYFVIKCTIQVRDEEETRSCEVETNP